MEWVDGNLGSKLTMKYPAIWLMGERAHGEVLSIAFAGKGQHQDAGGKCVHVAPNTTSVITSKSISKNGGRAGYRGLLAGRARARRGAKSKVVCDALILDEESRSDTYPYIQIDENEVDIGHEATVSKIGEEQLFYLMSRGLSEAEASAMIVSRLRRADHEGAAARVRRRDEPPDPAADGRLGWLDAAGRSQALRRAADPGHDRRALALHRPARLRPGVVRGRDGGARVETISTMLDLDVAGYATVTETASSSRRPRRACASSRCREDFERLYSLVGWDEKFAAHNAAMWKHGLLVVVPKGVELEKPLYVRIARDGPDVLAPGRRRRGGRALHR